uniref:2Fe-2S ferredoxin-type domain-containing protein n=1 Tax=Chromera velia CCMP2878 TaxID=1169474 RepID=A0A0G4F1Z0_9ALVE|eukprot:Cvel_14675.t1-p1 / transcript=Cvel_14675.t1 / gene=Cvel_14675 / organism=Chromera_velia_CCMP2878 / gene_product=2Fe-2S ferredoxin, putative / transcript_product=2Fe-2S ferredoxin, putative / location=Cvel_scaffold1052:31582-35887(-) / protein_length=160 / sequence_SO=supercontig / SO=protein_coding / is_pseudo=false
MLKQTINRRFLTGLQKSLPSVPTHRPKLSLRQPVAAGAVQFSRTFSSAPGETFVTFVSHSGEKSWSCSYRPGQSMLDVAFENDVPIEGACGGQCACSTCHIILKKEDFEEMGEPDEEELDMLDLAVGVTDTSRLGCQIRLKAENSGLTVELPSETKSQLS